MALQPQNYPNNPRPLGKPNGPEKPPVKILVIIIGVIVLVVGGIIFAIVRDVGAMSQGSSTPSFSSISLPESTPSQVQSTVEITSDPIGSVGELVEPDISVFSKDDGKFVISGGFQYPDTLAVAENNTIAFGPNLSVTPLKSCVFQFDGTRMSIAHPSGALLSMTRHNYRKELDTSEMNAAIQQHFTDSLAESVALSNVYVNTTVVGRCGTGLVEIDADVYMLKLAYIKIESEMYTLVALAEEDDADFMDLLMHIFKRGSTTIVWE